MQPGLGSDAALQVSSTPAASTSDNSKTSKKRKREARAEDAEGTPNKRRSMPAQSTPVEENSGATAREDLYQALRVLLDVLVAPAQTDSRSEENFDNESLKAVLRLDLTTAASLLGRWLGVTTNDASIVAVLEIWKHRITAASDDVLTVFSEQCLVPAMAMMQRLKSQQVLTENNTRTPTISQQISVLERLVAEHVILPAKRQIRQRLKDSSDGDEHGDDAMSGVFSSLRANRQIFDAIPGLFELAIRCTPMSTPRRRIAESPWVESVFLTLANCIGCDLYQRSKQNPAETSIFTELVKLASTHNVNLSRKTTKSILTNFVHRHEQSTDWNMLAQLVKIDSGLFVDEATTLRAVLIATRKASRADHVLIRVEILVPLLKAVVAARNLRKFISLWHDELKAIFEDWPASDRYHSLSSDNLIWEDANLTQALSQYLEVAMTPVQLHDLIADVTDRFATDAQPALIAAHASILVSILTSIRNVENVKIISAKIRTVLDLALSALQSPAMDKGVDHAKGRLWTLIATCHRLYTSTAAPADIAELLTTYDTKLDGLINARLGQGQRADFNQSPSDISSCVACLGSIASDIQARHLDLTSLSSTNSLSAFFRSIEVETSTSLLIDFADVLDSFPILLLQDEYSVEKAALTTLAINKWLRTMKDADHLRENEQVKESLSSVDIVKWTNLLDDCDNIATYKIASAPGEHSQHGDFLGQLVRTPLEYCTEEERNIYIGMLVTMMQHTIASVESWTAAISSMMRLLRHGTTTLAGMHTIDLVKIASRLDQYVITSPELTEHLSSLPLLFSEMCRLIFESHAQIKNGLRDHGMMQETKTLEANLNLDTPSHLATLALMKAIITATFEDRAMFSADEPSIIVILNRYLQEVIRDIHMEATPLRLLEISASLDILASIRAQEVVSENRELLEALLTNQTLRAVDNVSINVMLYSLDCNLRLIRNTTPDLEKTLALLKSIKARQHAKIVEDAVLNNLATAPIHLRLDFMKALTPPSGKQLCGVERLQLLRCLVRASSTARYRTIIPVEFIAPLASSLQLYLPRTTTFATFSCAAQSLQILLESQSKHLPQSVIENTLYTISSICSQSVSPRIAATPQHSRHIFTLTAKLLQTLLNHHRRKLRGRFELVVMALQVLLRCLFTRLSTSTSTSLSQPLWLPSKVSSVDGKGLDASHVSQYTRLLTSICDPTLSVVRSSSSKHGAGGLVDETRKAKRYAGQYVQYVLMELCECQLKGRLVGGAEGGREALTPGIWAMLEVIGKDGLSACMEGMAGGGKTLLRGYWEEWRTVGRGTW